MEKLARLGDELEDMKKYGDARLGVETGDPRKFKTWDEFWNAYVQQHLLFLKTAFTQQYIINKLRAEHFAQPMPIPPAAIKFCSRWTAAAFPNR